MSSDSSPLKRLREMCLSRGVHGIIGIGRTFRAMDDNGSRSLDRQELENGIRDFGLKMERAEIDELFNSLDRNLDSRISFDEFLESLRPPMSKARLDMIDKAFRKMDKTSDGVITVTDIKLTYDATHHPKYLSGEWTEDQVFKHFMDVFQPGDHDDKVTRDEFINYYSGVSASIDDDQYFVAMMKRAWKL
jgi:Ca2+-binding EF-hand superfamily protein